MPDPTPDPLDPTYDWLTVALNWTNRSASWAVVVGADFTGSASGRYIQVNDANGQTIDSFQAFSVTAVGVVPESMSRRMLVPPGGVVAGTGQVSVIIAKTLWDAVQIL